MLSAPTEVIFVIYREIEKSSGSAETLIGRQIEKIEHFVALTGSDPPVTVKSGQNIGQRHDRMERVSLLCQILTSTLLTIDEYDCVSQSAILSLLMRRCL